MFTLFLYRFVNENRNFWKEFKTENHKGSLLVSGRQFLKGILKVIQETFYEQYPMALFSNGFVKVTKKPFKNRFMLPIKERFMNVSIWFRNGFFMNQ